MDMFKDLLDTILLHKYTNNQEAFTEIFLTVQKTFGITDHVEEFTNFVILCFVLYVLYKKKGKIQSGRDVTSQIGTFLEGMGMRRPRRYLTKMADFVEHAINGDINSEFMTNTMTEIVSEFLRRKLIPKAMKLALLTSIGGTSILIASPYGSKAVKYGVNYLMDLTLENFTYFENVLEMTKYVGVSKKFVIDEVSWYLTRHYISPMIENVAHKVQAYWDMLVTQQKGGKKNPDRKFGKRKSRVKRRNPRTLLKDS